jgi:dolichol-phosphate mannosyltransferase
MNVGAPHISIVIPTYNERDNIERTLSGVIAILPSKACEIIVVDDDSPDRTWEFVERLSSKMPSVRLIRRTGMKHDLVSSAMEGFSAARGAILGEMDADGSHQPQAIVALLEAIENGCDLAVGSRHVAGGSVVAWPVHRLLLSKAATTMVRVLLRIELCDPLSGFYLVRREIYERMAATATPGGFKVLLELCVRDRPSHFAEIPIVFHNRTRGVSKLSASVVFHSFVAATRLIAFNLRRPKSQSRPRLGGRA